MTTYPLFYGAGLEIEWMIVDEHSLDVRAIADCVLRDLSGGWNSDHLWGDGMGCSNELVRHLLEVKNVAPTPDIPALAQKFQEAATRLQRALEPHGCRLLATAAHPWMDPKRDTVLWPHESADIYSAYDRVFDCRRHGWANLQSTHVNLPFGNEEEFGRLHAAARVLLPMIPALAAASPILEERRSGALDQRLFVYATNSARLPSLTGAVIPEPVFDIAGYREKILAPISGEVAPIDPDGTLQGEWMNARGAIARFDRDAIEIRLVDCQECPRADVAISQILFLTAKALCEERWSSSAFQRGFDTHRLRRQLDEVARSGETAVIADTAYLQVFGKEAHSGRSAGQIWRALVDELLPEGPLRATIDHILEKGTLATRILRHVDGAFTRSHLRSVYTELADCLRDGHLLDER